MVDDANQVPMATSKIEGPLRDHSKAPFISIFMDNKRRGGGGFLKLKEGREMMMMMLPPSTAVLL